MTLDNFIVRPKRLFVERYHDEKAWQSLTADQRHEIQDAWVDLRCDVVIAPHSSWAGSRDASTSEIGVPTAGRRLKCSRCDSKEIEIKPQLHDERRILRGPTGTSA